LREKQMLRVFENRVLRVFENRVLRKIFGAQEGRGNRGLEKTT
jgi:hypothetical protein